MEFYFLFVLALLLVPGLALAATSVGNNVSVGGTFALTGAATLNGHTTLGNVTSTDILYLNSRVASSIISTVNDAIDLGEFSRAYNDVFASGTVYADEFYGGTITATSTVTLNGAVTLGDAVGDDITITGYIASNVIPKTNDAYDLGAFAKAYNDVFASGTAYSASSTVYNPSTTSTVYVSSNATNIGGQIILKAYNGTCYAVYIGKFNDGQLGVTSTALSACY